MMKMFFFKKKLLSYFYIYNRLQTTLIYCVKQNTIIYYF